MTCMVFVYFQDLGASKIEEYENQCANKNTGKERLAPVSLS